MEKLNTLSIEINELGELHDTNDLSSRLTNGIYDACKRSLHTCKSSILPPNQNCTSKHIMAICDAHFLLYTHKLQNTDPVAETNAIAEKWWQYHCLALRLEKKEYNASVNKNWLHCKKTDSRRMRQLIDWNGQSKLKPPDVIDPEQVESYFKNIFQSELTKSHPTIDDINETLDNYDVDNHLTDYSISTNEVASSLLKVGKGTGLDGLPPSTDPLFPPSLCQIITHLLYLIFNGYQYPEDWKLQLLLPLTKKGHTQASPKLRGIAISSLLPRIYDTIIDERFKAWYKPNKEQSGFRKQQGCTLQLFYVILLLEMANYLHVNLFLLLVDYEKAFDFANRATIVEDMILHGLGTKFVNAVANMYLESGDVPKIRSTISTPILTKRGVTQGRKTSTNFFSFLIRDMPKYIQHYSYDDFMEPYNIAQMADDTVLAAGNESSLATKFECLRKFSDKKYQSINHTKTMYIHMSKFPRTQPIKCRDGTIINSLKYGDSIPYLGMHMTHTSKLEEIIKFNINKRMFNVAKYKSWLEVNKNTPFSVKLQVLDIVY